MKIKSVSFRNFKYVAKDREIKLDLSNAESLIMGGPNGYGKTTVFDALELLITGKIRHFNYDLPNKGKESIAVLANNIDSDICVAAEFISDNEIILVERRFVSINNFNSSLTMNSELIDDEKLFSILGISKNLFELGIYISQIDSLNFLQQKYKTRKESITGILDSSDIESRFNEFKRIQESLKNKFEQEEKEDMAKLSELGSERDKIGNALKTLQLSQEDLPYVRLFENKEYNFDKEFFEHEELYDVIISPVNDLIEFDKYKKAFFTKKRNNAINNIIMIDKRIYVALFFREEIRECITQKQIIDISNQMLKFKDSCQKKDFYLNANIIKALELSEESVRKINDLLLQKNSIEKGMTETQASLSKILKQRIDFLSVYKATVLKGVLQDNICPLCGRESENLANLLIDTESILKSNLGLIATQLTNVINDLVNLFETLIIKKIDVFLNQNNEIIEKNNILIPFLQLSTTDLEEKLKEENIIFINTHEKINFNIFEEKYAQIENELSKRLENETAVISNELYVKLLRISTEYYSDIQPYDEQVLMKKKFYISTLFSNTLNKKLKIAENNYITLDTKVKKKKNRYNSISENISTIVKKYDLAKKQYQSSIAKNIAVPMFVFSGKIIQNYPLGLGVLIKVENNAIVFKTGNIQSDIFNNLSTGQLNGVVISLLLSIKEVFTTRNSLNTLLIDDPLQTIDDISAISLIDLLSEHFSDTQIFLSTHEDDKQFLIRKKYEQSGNKCKVIDMQEEYLSQ